MYLPGNKNAIVVDIKITDYLLNLQHPDGRSKANFFLKAGFTLDNIADFNKFLLSPAQAHQVKRIEQTKFGTKYTIEGEVETPGNFRFNLRTVWMIETNSDIPKLITAYPIPL